MSKNAQYGSTNELVDKYPGIIKYANNFIPPGKSFSTALIVYLILLA
ncbi:16996_t:CDS:2 [Entrophospora sp. SA101]|nr:16996_t:CDS:2 [Entrophospora sp. SA101]